jgi:uncharacterized protein
MDTDTLPLDIQTTVRAYRTYLEAEGIPVQSVSVFGSYAKGTQRPESDIDVCVVSPVFGVNDVLEMQMLFRKALHIDTRIEPYPLSPSALADTWNPIVGEIVRTGCEVN